MWLVRHCEEAFWLFFEINENWSCISHRLPTNKQRHNLIPNQWMTYNLHCDFNKTPKASFVSSLYSLNVCDWSGTVRRHFDYFLKSQKTEVVFLIGCQPINRGITWFQINEWLITCIVTSTRHQRLAMYLLCIAWMYLIGQALWGGISIFWNHRKLKLYFSSAANQ